MFPVGLSQSCSELSCKEKSALAISVIVGIACLIILGLGASNHLPPQGNLPALIVGGVGVSLVLIGIMVALCKKDPFRELREEIRAALSDPANCRNDEELRNHAKYIKFLSDGDLLERVIKTKDLELLKEICRPWPKIIDYRSTYELIALYGSGEMFSYLYSLSHRSFHSRNSELIEDLFAQAIACNNLSTFTYLIHQFGVEPCTKNQRILYLHIAAEQKSLACFKKLIEIGVDVNQTDENGQRVLDLIVQPGKDPIYTKMLDVLAPRMNAHIQELREQIPVQLDTLKQEGKNACALLGEGGLIEQIVKTRNVAAFSYLLGQLLKFNENSDGRLDEVVCIENRNGYSFSPQLYTIVAQYGSKEVFAYLAEIPAHFGLEPSVVCDCFASAIHGSNPSIVGYLIAKHHVRFYINGAPLLHFAVTEKSLSCFKALVEAGADLGARDDQGRTVTDLLNQNQDNPVYKEMSELLSSRNKS